MMTRAEMLERSQRRDDSADGRFITGVLTTGIYCLPSCPAKKPNAENVRFFADERSARAAGLRPCKRCRPDLFYQDRDPELELAEELIAVVRRAPGELDGVGALADSLGIGATRLGELARRHLHESPATFVARERVRAAQRALADTDRRLLDVALDCGFESSSTFHDNFRRFAFMTPDAYRRLRDRAEFILALPRDYRANDMLRALARDPESPTERRRGGVFVKALELDGRATTLSIELAAEGARCRVAAFPRLTPRAMLRAHEAAIRMLGLRQDAHGLERRADDEPAIERLVDRRPGLRIPETASAFEGLCWAIIGQQINLRFAFTCRRALIELTGRRAPERLRAHPTPGDIAALDEASLTARKFSRRKAEYLIGAARLVAGGQLDVEGMRDGSAVAAERRLLAVHGIGPWSANYVLMRGLGFGDCTPAGDSGLASALQRYFDLGARPDAAETRRLMEPFAPHRSLATYHLWQTLGDPS